LLYRAEPSRRVNDHVWISMFVNSGLRLLDRRRRRRHTTYWWCGRRQWPHC